VHLQSRIIWKDRLLADSRISGTCGPSLRRRPALIRSGALPSVRIDGARRIRASDLEHYIASLQALPEPA
jgi:hypothetical protein